MDPAFACAFFHLDLEATGLTLVLARRIELSLKTKGWATLEDLKEGQIVRGRVRRAERFGVFVRIDDSSVTGTQELSLQLVKTKALIYIK